MTAVLAPPRTLDQRMDALAKAHVVRQRRVDYKAELKLCHAAGGSATLMAAAMIERPEWWAASWRAGDLLFRIPKIGRVRRQKIMRRLGIAEAKTLAGLSDRQRAALVHVLMSPDTTYDGLSFPDAPPLR